MYQKSIIGLGLLRQAVTLKIIQKYLIFKETTPINMKTLMSIFLLFLVTTTSAQRLQRDEIDRFTKDTITETIPEYLFGSIFTPGRNGFQVSVRRVNSAFYLFLTAKTNTPFQVTQNDIFYLLLNGEEVVKLNPMFYEMSDVVFVGELSGAVHAVRLTFKLDQPLMDKFKENLVSAIRLTTSAGYIEEDIVSRDYELIGRHIKAVEGLSDFKR